MGIQKQLDEVKGIRIGLQEAREEYGEEITNALGRGGQLRDAARRVGESSSGSWIGWHSRMYYRDFEEPPVVDTWSTEWGGINGFSENWQEHSLPEIQDAVEQLAENRLADLSASADRVRVACQPLQQELLTVLSPVCDFAGLEREGELLREMESIEWVVSPSNFVQAIAPKQMMSRDSEALHQGMQAPLHLNVEAAIVSNTSTLAKAREFLDSAVRLARQTEAKLSVISEGTGSIVAGTVDSKAAKQLQRRSVALFVLLTGLVAGGVVLGLRELDGPVAIAALLVVAVLAVAGVYALLLNRGHAARALAIAGGVVGAVAAVQQLVEGL